MALPFEELESITNDYFMIDGGKAVDIYFYTSFLLNYLMKQHNGLWERPSGGRNIRVPLEYDGQESGFYGRGDTISSDDNESITAAYFEWKHAYGNATIYRLDNLENANNTYGMIQLVTQRLSGAQKSLTSTLAGSIYDASGGSSKRLTGLLACCNETATTSYGGIAEDDLVANDGTKPWEGKTNSTAEAIDLKVLRDMCTAAKIRDGVSGKPNLYVTTEDLFNAIVDILQIQQRFVKDDKTAKAGFTGVEFEGKSVFPDDYCPSGYAFALNSVHLGFAVHKRGYYVRSPWRVIEGSPEDKTMKIYWDGNMVVNNRKAHQAHSDLTA